MPITDTGTATIGISVARTLRRKTNTTSVTKTTAMTSVTSVSASEERMLIVLSSWKEISIELGSAAFSFGTAALISSTV